MSLPRATKHSGRERTVYVQTTLLESHAQLRAQHPAGWAARLERTVSSPAPARQILEAVGEGSLPDLMLELAEPSADRVERDH
jgi:hypothetical protein